MKNYTVLFLILIISNLSASHSEKAMEYLKNENYIECISEWEKELKSQDANHCLVYNHIANAYFQRQDYSRAICYFEKSLKENYIQNDVRFNIKVCRAKLNLDTENKTLFTNDWIHKIAYLIPYYSLKLLIIVFAIASLFISILYYFQKKKYVSGIRKFLIFFVFLLIALCYLQSYYRSQNNMAIIGEQTLGYDQPGLKGKSKTIMKGERVEVKDEIGQTVQIKTELDILYWIDKSAIYPI